MAVQHPKSRVDLAARIELCSLVHLAPAESRSEVEAYSSRRSRQWWRKTECYGSSSTETGHGLMGLAPMEKRCLW